MEGCESDLSASGGGPGRTGGLGGRTDRHVGDARVVFLSGAHDFLLFSGFHGGADAGREGSFKTDERLLVEHTVDDAEGEKKFAEDDQSKYRIHSEPPFRKGLPPVVFFDKTEHLFCFVRPL